MGGAEPNLTTARKLGPLLIDQYPLGALGFTFAAGPCLLYHYSEVHCNENPIYVFLFWELRGLSPNFHIHVSVSDLYFLKIVPHISCSRIGRSMVGIYKSFTDTRIGNEAVKFLFWEYLLRIFGIGSLQCANKCFKLLCHLCYYIIPGEIPFL